MKFFDSMGGAPEKSMVKFLQNKFTTTGDVITVDVPRQQNGDDCGVYVLATAEQLAKDGTILQINADQHRIAMHKVLKDMNHALILGQ